MIDLGDFLLLLVAYGVALATLCALIGMVARTPFKFLALVFVTVYLGVTVVLVGYASGMANSDFTLGFVLPFLLAGFVVAALLATLLRKKVRTNG